MPPPRKMSFPGPARRASRCGPPAAHRFLGSWSGCQHQDRPRQRHLPRRRTKSRPPPRRAGDLNLPSQASNRFQGHRQERRHPGRRKSCPFDRGHELRRLQPKTGSRRRAAFPSTHAATRAPDVGCLRKRRHSEPEEKQHNTNDSASTKEPQHSACHHQQSQKARHSSIVSHLLLRHTFV